MTSSHYQVSPTTNILMCSNVSPCIRFGNVLCGETTFRNNYCVYWAYPADFVRACVFWKFKYTEFRLIRFELFRLFFQLGFSVFLNPVPKFFLAFLVFKSFHLSNRTFFYIQNVVCSASATGAGRAKTRQTNKYTHFSVCFVCVCMFLFSYLYAYCLE